MKYNLLARAFILFYILLSISSYSQGLALLEDYQNRLYLFNNGVFTQLEYSKTKQKFIGKNFIAYVDYLDNLKIWYKQKLLTINMGLSNIKSTENILTWTNQGKLYVWDNGNIQILGNNVKRIFTKGEIVCYIDNYDNTIKVYYKKHIYNLITNNYIIQANALSIGRGTVTLFEADNNLITFIKGKVKVEKMVDENTLFLSGQNGILINNTFENTLKYYTSDGNFELCRNNVTWFDIKYNWILWIDESESVYVLVNYKKTLLSNTRPTFINISPKSIIFEEYNQLNIMYNNKINQVAYYMPQEIKHYNDKVVFRNNIGQIEYYENGKNKVISSAPNSKFQMYYDVIVISEGTRRFVYYKNTKYEL